MIRILVVEDSATVRGLLTAMFQSDPALQVVGTAANGEEAVRKALALKPDLITMDIRMPLMDGIEATQRIMTECPTPIVVVTAVADGAESRVTFDAIQAGALDVLQKPVGLNHAEFETIRERLVSTVKLMAGVKVVRRHSRKLTAPMTTPLPALRSPPDLLVIGASTGGPAALNTLLRGLPPEFPLPIVVVQHMSAGFLPSLVSWLQLGTRLQLVVAQDGQALSPGRVFFAPDDHHLVVASRGRLGLSAAPPVSHVRPSATVLFNSAAAVYGSRVTGLLLTGMGDDGALGLKAIRDRGGLTLAQDEASSVVYGMPRVAAELGAVERVLHLERVAAALLSLVVEQR
jgi:two-component system, chemotaxis family, protein-glutamate methylesterase/glutaminase